MAQVTVSAAEAALENQRIGGLQLRVAALCTLVQICDGYDLNSVAWAVPSLIKAWHLPPPMFTTAFLWSSIGILVGALSAGPIGDRFGRRPLLLASLTIFGLASLLSATANSIATLSLWRFFTGIGIGGGFSGAAALTGDYAPHRLRATMIMATFTGAPLGGFLGGQIVAVLLAHYDWPVIFILGGVFPLVLVLALALWLPESPRFLARKQNLSPSQAALLHRLDIAPTQDHAVDVAQGNPVRLLFSEGYALQTVLLWIIYFCSLMNLFLFAYWMPTVLTMIGMSPPQAVFASSLRDFGAIFAVLYLGLAIDRIGPERIAGAALRRRRRVHRGDRARRAALCDAAGHELPGRDDDHRQPDRRQRHLRQTLSRAHAHQRTRLGARHRTARRHRRAAAGRLPAGDRPQADAHLSERLPVRADRRGGGGTAGIPRQPRPGWRCRGGRVIGAPDQGSQSPSTWASV